MTLALAWLRSRRLTMIAAACAVLALAGMSAADATLQLPGLRRSLPLSRVIVGVRAGRHDAAVQPIRRPGDVAAQSPRRPRASRSLHLRPCGPRLPARQRGRRRPLPLTLLAIMTIAVQAVTALGPLGWMPPTALSLVTLYVDVNNADPIRSALDAVGLPALSTALVACVLAYAAIGPRSS